MFGMLENSKIIVDIDNCTKCKACANECSLLIFDSGTINFADATEEECIECGKCVAVCPENVIKLKVHGEIKLENVPSKDELPSFNSLINLFQTRRSRRQFKKKPVPNELIEKILNQAAKYSPTGHNQENVHFTVVQNQEVLNRLSEECTNQVKNLIKTFGDPQARKALATTFPPALIKKVEEVLPAFKNHIKEIKQGKEVWRRDAEIIIIHSPKDALTGMENCALAACHIMLAAETLGLGTCSLGYITSFFNEFKPVAKIVKLPLKHFVGYTLAIGYPKAHYYRIPARKPIKVNWL
jgi:nitroreductase/NAD-dependent dihydropyrimidine dehydrogenase PreA subunit